MYRRPHSWNEYISSLKTQPYMENETKDHGKKPVQNPNHATPSSDTQGERTPKEKEAEVPARANMK